MDEISNQTLAILLVAAIVISLGGTLISLNRLSRVGIPLITGRAADDTADIDLIIGTETDILFTVDSINWGTGTVDIDSAHCTLDSYSTPIHANCSDFTPVTEGLILRNIGNTIVSLNISAGKNAETFIGHESAVYQWNMSDYLAGSCDNWGGFGEGAWQDASTTNTTTCTEFLPSPGQDQLRMDVRVVIPRDSPVGAKEDIITATATVAP